MGMSMGFNPAPFSANLFIAQEEADYLKHNVSLEQSNNQCSKNQ